MANVLIHLVHLHHFLLQWTYVPDGPDHNFEADEEAAATAGGMHRNLTRFVQISYTGRTGQAALEILDKPAPDIICLALIMR